MSLCSYYYIGLLLSLLVGITLRTQTNRAGLYGILDRIKSYNEPKEKFDLKALEEKMKKIDGKKISVADAVKGPERGYWAPILVSWLMCGIPSIAAILLADSFINYIESAAGLLAPAFIIFFPCMATIKMHKEGIAPLSNFWYIATWVYMIGGLFVSYLSLGVNLYLIISGQKSG